MEAVAAIAEAGEEADRTAGAGAGRFVDRGCRRSPSSSLSIMGGDAEPDQP
jgi:hypothetical protein